jgi:hypothetical protein
VATKTARTYGPKPAEGVRTLDATVDGGRKSLAGAAPWKPNT